MVRDRASSAYWLMWDFPCVLVSLPDHWPLVWCTSHVYKIRKWRPTQWIGAVNIFSKFAAMKILRVPRCGEHQFRPKIMHASVVSTWTVFELSLFGQRSEQRKNKSIENFNRYCCKGMTYWSNCETYFFLFSPFCAIPKPAYFPLSHPAILPAQNLSPQYNAPSDIMMMKSAKLQVKWIINKRVFLKRGHIQQ